MEPMSSCSCSRLRRIRRNVAVGDDGLVRHRELLEGMAAFMEKRVDVTVRARGVHKDEGRAFPRSRSINRRSLAYAAVGSMSFPF